VTRNGGHTIVIGVGNEFRRDDGVGPAVIAELERRSLPEVLLTRSDGEPTALFDAWDGARLAVVVDAVRHEPSVPGQIHRCLLPGQFLGRAPSTHGLGIPEAVRLAAALDRVPRQLVVYAVEAADYGFGLGLSEPVARAVPEVVAAVIAEVTC
jgi:hydrogenase maturation protease